MSHADGVRAELNTALDDLEDSLHFIRNAGDKIEAVTGTVLTVGLIDSNSHIAGAAGLGQVMSLTIGSLIHSLFELRQTLILYRDKL